MERLQPADGGDRDFDSEPIHTAEEPSTDLERSTQPNEPLADAQLIYLNITEALREGRAIDHATVRAIAAGLHSGQATALYALASSGAVVDGLASELEQCRADSTLGVEVEPWFDALDDYLAHRDSPEPIEGWADLWPMQPSAANSDDEAEARANLMARISAASVTTLGEVATIVDLANSTTANEVDRFSWADASRWDPDAVASEDVALHPDFTDDEVDAMFGDGADLEIGTLDDLGWFGLARWHDRPGGLILRRDQSGQRHTWVVATDAALERQWQTILGEYRAFYAQREAYEQAIREVEETVSGLRPRVWVGSLADYNAGNLHGAWFDATREPEDLELASRYLLRLSEYSDAEEWAVMDYDDFPGVRLRQYAPFEVVSRIAQGVAEHGEAFGHWAAHIGSEDLDQLDAFEDHYRGEWESFEAYIESYLEGTGFYAYLDAIPEDMRGYVEVDVQAIARDWGGDYLVVELRNGRVGIMDLGE